MKVFGCMFALGALAGCSFDSGGVGSTWNQADATIRIMIDDGGTRPVDAALGNDARPTQPIDAAPQPQCPLPDGSRTCDGDWVTLCMGGQMVHQRICPQSSICLVGECLAPFGAQNCASDGDCSGGQVCTPFVVRDLLPFVPPDLRLYCATPRSGAGTGGTGSACSSGTQCRTGVCHEGVCYSSCQTQVSSTNQCGSLDCKLDDVRVDGTQDSLPACLP